MTSLRPAQPLRGAFDKEARVGSCTGKGAVRAADEQTRGMDRPDEELLSARDMIISADGRWIWDGRRWAPTFGFVVPSSPPRRLPRWLLATGPVWLVSLSAWVFVASALLLPKASTGTRMTARGVQGDLEIVLGLACFAVAATIAWGALLGRRRAFHWLWIAAAVGTFTLMFGYVVAMLASPQQNVGADNDNAAGAGVAILTIPTAAAVLALLWLGAGIGLLSRVMWRPGHDLQ
jgi:hypothetical protein